ncbi:MAG: ABC transporter substrate-binding protein [Acidimicrobiia bacterium]
MTRQQYWVLALVGGLSVFIGVGIALLITSGDGKDEVVQIGPTTSSQGPVVTTLPPSTTLTSTPTTAPPVTQGTITPGTTLVIPPSTSGTTRPAPTTTRPAPTTTEAPATTTTTGPDRSTDVGITDDEIRLAVIADSPTTFQGMATWQTLVNRHGGLADRRVELDLLETGGSAEGYAEAVTTACKRDFAIVGSFSVFDAAADALGCAAIPDLPVEPIAADHATASTTFAAFPRQPGIEAVGPYKWLLANVPGCCSQFVLVPDTDPARARTLAAIDAAVAAGFTTAGSVDVTGSDDAARYTEIVDEIETNGATFASSGLGPDSTRLLREATAARGPDVAAWYCGAQCYDASFLADGGDAIDGEYVAIETALFSDRSEISLLRSYVRISNRAGDDTAYEGLRAFVAGLLFESGAEQVIDEHGDNGITRVRLFEALAGINDFTAGGIVGPTDVASGTPTGCYVLMQVSDARFDRVNPADKGVIDCGSQNLVEMGG